MGPYIVAFRYTRKTGGYHGVITWTIFPSKEDFDKWYTPEIREREEVVEEGISEKRAVELTHSTPLACRIAASVQEATGEDGEVNKDILDMTTKMAIFAEQMARKY